MNQPRDPLCNKVFLDVSENNRTLYINLLSLKSCSKLRAVENYTLEFKNPFAKLQEKISKMERNIISQNM